MVAVRQHLADDALAWLLRGDVAVQFQTYRDLLGDERPELQRRIASEGDAGAILAAHTEPGWGRGFYEPKWTCPHCSRSAVSRSWPQMSTFFVPLQALDPPPHQYSRRKALMLTDPSAQRRPRAFYSRRSGPSRAPLAQRRTVSVSP